MVAFLMSATVVRRDVFTLTGGFDEALRYGEDIDWYSRARHAGFPGTVVEQQLYVRRVHRTNMMHDHTQADFRRAMAAVLLRQRRARRAREDAS